METQNYRRWHTADSDYTGDDGLDPDFNVDEKPPPSGRTSDLAQFIGLAGTVDSSSAHPPVFISNALGASGSIHVLKQMQELLTTCISMPLPKLRSPSLQNKHVRSKRSKPIKRCACGCYKSNTFMKYSQLPKPVVGAFVRCRRLQRNTTARCHTTAYRAGKLCERMLANLQANVGITENLLPRDYMNRKLDDTARTVQYVRRKVLGVSGVQQHRAHAPTNRNHSKLIANGRQVNQHSMADDKNDQWSSDESEKVYGQDENDEQGKKLDKKSSSAQSKRNNIAVDALHDARAIRNHPANNATRWNTPWQGRLPRDHIRLLSFRYMRDDGIMVCNMDPVMLPRDDDFPKIKYQAVSYSWGKPGRRWKIMPIIINGYLVWVWPNLHAAMVHLWTQSRNLKLWLDALSINQLDVQERNEQVGLMSEIFSKAQRVTVWLGAVKQRDFKLVQDGWKVITRARYGHQNFSGIAEAVFRKEPDHKDKIQLSKRSSLVNFMELVSKRAWFHRVWTVQEILVAKKASIHLGDFTMEWEDFYEGFRRIAYEVEIFDRFERSWNLIRPAVLGVRDETLNLTQLLISTRHRDATDDRDRVFALVGLLRNSTQEELDEMETKSKADDQGYLSGAEYSLNVEDCFIKAVRHCILVDQSLKILELTSPLEDITLDDGGLDDDDDIANEWVWACEFDDNTVTVPKTITDVLTRWKTKTLPSWVPDLRSNRTRFGLLSDFQSVLIAGPKKPRPLSTNETWHRTPMYRSLGDPVNISTISLGGLILGKITPGLHPSMKQLISLAQCTTFLRSRGVPLGRIHAKEPLLDPGQSTVTNSIIADIYMHHVAKPCQCLTRKVSKNDEKKQVRFIKTVSEDIDEGDDTGEDNSLSETEVEDKRRNEDEEIGTNDLDADTSLIFETQSPQSTMTIPGRHLPTGTKDDIDWLCYVFGSDKLYVLRSTMVESPHWAKTQIATGQDHRLAEFSLVGIIPSELTTTNSGPAGWNSWNSVPDQWKEWSCLPMFFNLV